MNRLARRDDLDRVFAIAMQESVLRFLNFEPMPKEAFAPVFDKLVDTGAFFVREEEGAVVAFFKAARGELHTRHVAYLSLLAVDPALEGRGIARRMMTEAIETLRAEGTKRIELGVESTNTRAIAFYEKLGFEIEGTLRMGYESPHEGFVDDFVMGLLLFD
ncbi:MAG TPA: GNAT family N-acetyltransferase [Rhodanobacteraceae bacterium]|nr:GNAT family N-acetyltransferase [Rhodanobacteraceae bacterium]